MNTGEKIAVTRKCKYCSQEKSLEEFPKDYTRGDTKYLKISYRCKSCFYTYQQKYNKKKNRVRYTNLEIDRRTRYKEEAIRLKGNCCQDCKKSFPTPVYDFHHLNPNEKEHSIAKLFMGSWEKLLVELDKCVLLCANCHRIRHFVNKEFKEI